METTKQIIELLTAALTAIHVGLKLSKTLGLKQRRIKQLKQ